MVVVGAFWGGSFHLLAFSRSALSSHDDATKLSYAVGVLRGRVQAWAEAYFDLWLLRPAGWKTLCVKFVFKH